MLCPTEPIPPPTERAQTCVGRIKILMFTQLGLGLAKLFMGEVSGGMMDLIACFILWSGYTQLNFCTMVIYIFFCGMTAVQILAMIGTILQNGGSLIPNRFELLVYLVYGSLILYLIGIYIAFQSYKEFKAISAEDSGSLLGNAGMPSMFPAPGGQNIGSSKVTSTKV